MPSFKTAQFRSPPTTLTIVVRDIEAHDVHCGVVENNAGERIFVAMCRSSKANFAEHHFMPNLSFLSAIWAHEKVQEELEKKNVRMKGVRQPWSDDEHVMLLRLITPPQAHIMPVVQPAAS